MLLTTLLAAVVVAILIWVAAAPPRPRAPYVEDRPGVCEGWIRVCKAMPLARRGAREVRNRSPWYSPADVGRCI